VVLPLVGHGGQWARWKQVATAALEARFGPRGANERTPPKHQEMRVGGMSAPSWLLAGLPAAELAASLEAMPGVKFARHLRRNAKLRLFRIWKLFNESLKHPEEDGSSGESHAYRQVGERLRTLGFIRRL
jgi:hypothetical protein